jgi:phospholipase D1/2
MDRPGWIRVATVLIVCLVVVAMWSWIPSRGTWDLDAVSAWLAPHRHAWYGLPIVVFAFIALSPVPVMLLIAATGIAFGPVLGPLYAMAGCLSSGSVAFAIGRWLGLRRVQELGGDRIVRLTGMLKRNGTLAVFLVRKVPAPFTLVNIVIGASTVRYRDFLVGTTLGMGAMIIALAGFGYQLTVALRRPSAETVVAAVLFVSVPLTLALLINRALRGARTA